MWVIRQTKAQGDDIEDKDKKEMVERVCHKAWEVQYSTAQDLKNVPVVTSCPNVHKMSQLVAKIWFAMKMEPNAKCGQVAAESDCL